MRKDIDFYGCSDPKTVKTRLKLYIFAFSYAKKNLGKVNFVIRIKIPEI